MPRKRWCTRLSSYHVPDDHFDIPQDDVAIRHALIDFDELGVLAGTTREQLVTDLMHAVRFARCGIKAGQRGMSDKALTQQIFLSDVGRALERAGLPVKRWRKRYDDGDGPSFDAPESFFFRLARKVAAVSAIILPQDLKLPGKRTAQHRYGVMSAAMKVAQEAELAAQRQCVNDPDV
jgi:hypothetical protein